MRLVHLQSSRPPWYDRNPLAVGVDVGYPAQPNHAAITLASYTVPTNRKFMLETAVSTVWRDTAAAPAGLVTAKLQIGNAGYSAVMPVIRFINNTVQFRLDFNVPLQCVMLASDLLTFVSEDLSVGGTTTLYFSFKGTEFDAQ